MRILLLQLKRIGDLVLTTPALAALRAALPEARIALAVDAGTAELLPAIEGIDEAIVFGKGRGWTPWQQVLTGRWDACLDFTGTDRSALAALLSRAPKRISFAWLREKGFRARAYTRLVESVVRERHTVTHYLDLLAGLELERGEEPLVRLRLHDHGRVRSALPAIAREESRTLGPYVVLHPGSARAEKFWLAERWAEVARHLLNRHGLEIVITTGPDPVEQAHVDAVQRAMREVPCLRSHPGDLLVFTETLRDAALVISCDTAAVHLAAAFQRPQIALFGPTNPFHWRPRHERALVISAAQPEAPLRDFEPRMKGAPMERISARAVCGAIDTLLESKP